MSFWKLYVGHPRTLHLKLRRRGSTMGRQLIFGVWESVFMLCQKQLCLSTRMMRFIAKRKAAVLDGVNQNFLRLRLNNSMLGSLSRARKESILTNFWNLDYLKSTNYSKSRIINPGNHYNTRTWTQAHKISRKLQSGWRSMPTRSGWRLWKRSSVPLIVFTSY